MLRDKRWGRILRSTLLLAVLSGCATPHVVDEIKISDRDLTCDALLAEISKANAYERSAEEDRASGEGTKAALINGIIFPPIWAAIPVLMMVDGTTNSKVNDAVEAARRRRNHLYDLYNKKKCSEN